VHFLAVFVGGVRAVGGAEIIGGTIGHSVGPRYAVLRNAYVNRGSLHRYSPRQQKFKYELTEKSI